VSVRFYMDHNVQGAVVDALRVRGVDCLTAQEDGTITLDDDSLLARATELGRVLVTHDKDFFTIFETWWSAGRTLAGIVHSLPTQLRSDSSLRICTSSPRWPTLRKCRIR
jgi:hypothetical protein